MSNASEAEHPVPTAVPRANFFSEWLDIMQTTDLFLQAGLRRKIGPDGDMNAALREWYAGYMREHDDSVRQLVRNLHQN